MARDNQEINDWLNSSQGQLFATVVIAAIVVGFLAYIVMSLTGWLQWVVGIFFVAVLVAAAWYFISAREKS